MGRPRKYHTTDERRQADCRKSKKWYDRNQSAAARAQIAGKSSTNVAQVAGSGSSGSAVQSLSPAQSKPVSKEAFWNARVARITIKLDKLFEHQEGRVFIQNLYDQLLVDRLPSPLDDALAVASRLQTSIYRYSEEILNLSGMGKDWLAADAVRTRVSTTVRGLQEVIVDAIIDLDDLKRRHSRKELIFQSLV
ncbi:hypothetical protein H0H92_006475 [Tricholoma furcatifolium]|nr:hypothetical protein H0H92_006475 [Tricholoma furcatifolium]